ncbi:sensor histidine kinase [Enterococcus avium]|uniref:sensor histidine kinase n=1 Tax=Enterococcus avium TaxID=33945 RepID=UPI00159D08E1|nr:GHKL domain-containing protein [Enterococcus avium]NVN77988.1 GHKL domain-containing protein [Enterococcus avium]
MIYFYTQDMSTRTAVLTYLFQMTPSLIVYLATLKYCFPDKITKFSIGLTAISTYNLGWVFNNIIKYYYQDVLVIHNIFSIFCQTLMILILYLVFNRGNRLFLINLLLVTCFTILTAGVFEYIRIFLINISNSPFFSINVVNWYFLISLLFLPLLKKFLARVKKRIVTYSSMSLVAMWTLLIAMTLFALFIQVSSITKPSNYTGYTSTIFLSNNHLGAGLIRFLAPSANFIVEPVHELFTVGTILVIQNTLAIGAFVFLLFLNKRSKQIVDEQEKQKYELTQYINSLESVTQNIRKNHHDFSNLLFSLGGYIYQTPINEADLKAYFENVTQTFEEDYHYFLELSKLKNLEIPELKTLIFTKIMRATKLDIPFDIEVEQPVGQMPIDHLALSRIFGILIDNALEAASESKQPSVRLAIIDDNEQYVFILVNTTKNKTLSPSLLQRENFSTKGKNRGLGLSIVDSIIQAHSEQLALKTTQNGQEFCQTLFLKKG